MRTSSSTALAPLAPAMAEAVGVLRAWTPRRWGVAAGVTVVAGLVTGLPTDVVPNPFYVRMTPVLWWNYPVWALSAALLGLVAATYVRAPGGHGGGRALGGGLLSFLAVGCPICNKLVVALLGVGGALSIFAPLQPWLAALGLALLAVTLALRLRALSRCAVR